MARELQLTVGAVFAKGAVFAAAPGRNGAIQYLVNVTGDEVNVGRLNLPTGGAEVALPVPAAPGYAVFVVDHASASVQLRAAVGETPVAKIAAGLPAVLPLDAAAAPTFESATSNVDVVYTIFPV